MAEWSGENRRLDYNGGNPLGRVVMSVALLVELESDRWFLWVPVFFGAGIGLYFALPVEPAVYSIIAALCITLSLSVATRNSAFAWTLCVACFCASLGFADARLRTLMVAQPSLEHSGGFQVLRGWVEKTEARLPRGHRISLRPFSSSKMKYNPCHTGCVSPAALTRPWSRTVSRRRKPAPDGNAYAKENSRPE